MRRSAEPAKQQLRGRCDRLREQIQPGYGPCGLSYETVCESEYGGGFISEEIGKLPGTDGDTGRHDDRTGGFPTFTGFPRWDTISRHTAQEGRLRTAFAAGLRVEVVSAVGYDFICRASPVRKPRPSRVRRDGGRLFPSHSAARPSIPSEMRIKTNWLAALGVTSSMLGCAPTLSNFTAAGTTGLLSTTASAMEVADL